MDGNIRKANIRSVQVFEGHSLGGSDIASLIGK